MATPFETIREPVMADRPVVGSSLTNELAFRIQEDILRGVLAPLGTDVPASWPTVSDTSYGVVDMDQRAPDRAGDEDAPPAPRA